MGDTREKRITVEYEDSDGCQQYKTIPISKYGEELTKALRGEIRILSIKCLIDA